MTPYTSYLEMVMVNAVDCLEDVALQAIGGAIIRFCEDTLIWQVDLPVIDVTQDVDIYSVAPVDVALAETRVVIPVFVAYNENEIRPVLSTDLDRLTPNWRNADSGTPNCYIVEDVNEIRLNRKPEADITGGLFVRVALKPTQDATEASDDIYEDWREAIEAGALSTLYGMNAKQWTDKKEAAAAGRLFNFYIQRAKGRLSMGHTNHNTAVQMRSW